MLGCHVTLPSTSASAFEPRVIQNRIESGIQRERRAHVCPVDHIAQPRSHLPSRVAQGPGGAGPRQAARPVVSCPASGWLSSWPLRATCPIPAANTIQSRIQTRTILRERDERTFIRSPHRAAGVHTFLPSFRVIPVGLPASGGRTRGFLFHSTVEFLAWPLGLGRPVSGSRLFLGPATPYPASHLTYYLPN